LKIFPPDPKVWGETHDQVRRISPRDQCRRAEADQDERSGTDFRSKSTNSAALSKKIERTLQQALGYEVTIILRTIAELEALVRRDPFKKIKTGDQVMLFVVFLSNQTKPTPKLPLISIKENLELFEIKDGAAFIVSRRKQNGWFGFPNAFVEKELGVVGTTRNWNTVNKIVHFAEALRERRK